MPGKKAQALMKVLHIITRMNTGGPAVFLDHLTNAMKDLDTQSTIAFGWSHHSDSKPR